MNDIIKSKVPDNKYTIKNSMELVKRIERVHVPCNSKFVSFDVVSLFTKVPVDECCDVVEKLLFDLDTELKQIKEIMTLLREICRQNYLVFNKKFYEQKEGLSMGSPISPILADIFMNYIETKILSSKNKLVRNVVYWHRYVDDILCLWNGSDRQLDQFLKFINSFHQNIQFTMEKEKNNTINFLDLTISKHNNTHQFQIYRKDTYSDIIIHKDSNTHHRYKIAAIQHMVHRALTIPMNQENFHKEKNTIYKIALNNGFNLSTVDSILQKFNYKLAIKQACNLIHTQDNSNYVSVPYLGKISVDIGKILSKNGMKVSYKTIYNLRQLLGSPKDKDDRETLSGVYKLKCNDCHAVYIGQTGRQFKERVAEHIRAWRYNKTEKSHFAAHLIENEHNFSSDNF